MSQYTSREQSLPLATEGYVLGVRERYIQVQRIAGEGIVPSVDLSAETIGRRIFSISHIAPRLSIRSVGGINSSIRSQSVALAISQSNLRLGASAGRVSLSLSKN